MERRIEKRVDSWESRPFTDGYDELRDLASGEFSGAIDASGTQVFMLNGRIIGVFGGDIETLEDAQGTVFRAPHPALSLLYTMEQKGGETRAKYYTEETSLRDVDQKLSEGSFTGYIKLSENVLSGDYYHVYYGGKAMHAAFVGTNDRLITDEEAFEQAIDEVGIYEVINVDIDITEIPSEDDPDNTVDSAPGGTESGEAEEPADQASTNRSQAGGPDVSPGGEHRREQSSSPEGKSQQPSGRQPEQPREQQSSNNQPSRTTPPESEASQPPTDQQPPNNQPPPEGDPKRSQRPPTDEGRSDEDQTRRAENQRRHTTEQSRAADESNQPPAADGRPDRTGGGQPRTDTGTNRNPGSDEQAARSSGRTEQAETAGHPGDAVSSASSGGRERTEPASRSGDVGESPDTPREDPAGQRSDVSGEAPASSRFDKEAAWREADTIPSLDPDRTRQPDGTGESSPVDSPQQPTEQPRNTRRSAESATGDGEVDDTFDAEILEREDRIDRLTQRVANLEAERDDLRRERDELARKVDQLHEENTTLTDELELLGDEVERLEAELAAARTADDSASSAGGADNDDESPGQELSKADALSGTDLFVRYDSKSSATLEDVHSGNADPAEVNNNLRLEQHTRFEADSVTVDGQPYLSFLRETLEYRFVNWFVTQLPYEIRDTGHADALSDLYDTYSTIDRAELDGSVSVEYTDESETIREQATFDIVLRDRMGSPLVVANLNDRRDPASEEMMIDLNEAAMRVKESNDSLGAAVLVTESFFSPGALETAAEATGGSFLSRDSRESFVKLSRKRGYHLCLVEARDQDFHLNEPEL